MTINDQIRCIVWNSFVWLLVLILPAVAYYVVERVKHLHYRNDTDESLET